MTMKKNALFYFGLKIFLPIQIQLEIENPKNLKIGCTGLGSLAMPLIFYLFKTSFILWSLF
jgi:hypothetical protein